MKLLGRASWLLVALGATAAFACGELKSSAPIADGGAPGADDVEGADGSTTPPDDEPPSKDAGVTKDGGFTPGPKVDGGAVGPSAACRTIPLDCLDPAPANVIEVTTESTLDAAIANAKTGDTIQVRGKKLGSGWKIPAYVTLRGCEGAAIDGSIAFAGSGGTIEGFVVSGSIVANQTGSYVVRYNRFVGGAPLPAQAGVSGRSIDALVSASVTLVVESNWFEGRPYGVEARTSYDTLTHAVDITVRNNVFVRVPEPFLASESGIVGVVNAKLEHNTFYDFGTAIRLANVDRKTVTSGNLFVKGTKAIDGSAYDVAYSFAWQVTTPAGTPPVSGTFATGDPALVDPDAGDVRLGPGSSAVDAIPNGTTVPAEDYQGCPRPAGAAGASPKSDVGAFESQP